MKRRGSIFVVLCSGLVSLASCGSDSSENVFALLDEQNKAQMGEAALASGDVDAAIGHLESALAENPNDKKTRRMLATAYLSQSGVDTFEIVARLSEGDEPSDFQAALGAMPEPTQKNLAGMKRAVELLDAIPESERSDDERYQLAMAQTSLAVTTAKKYGTGEDGQISEEDAAQITNEDASLVIEQLDGAAGNLRGLSTPDSESADKLSGLSERIQSSEGDTSAQKLQSFLASERQAGEASSGG